MKIEKMSIESLSLLRPLHKKKDLNGLEVNDIHWKNLEEDDLVSVADSANKTVCGHDSDPSLWASGLQLGVKAE
jgi:hypothetical protein